MDSNKMNNMNELYLTDKDEIIDIAGYFAVIYQNRYFLILFSVLMGLIVGVYSKFYMTPQYSSTADIYVLSTSDSNSPIMSLTDLQAGSNLQEDYIAVIQQRDILEEVIDQLNLEMDYKELSGKLTVSAYTKRIISISVKDSDPKRAKLMADTVADVSAAFIDEHMHQTPPSVLHYGYDDGLKVSPRTKRNAAAGVLIGFMLGICFLVAYKISNNTIESSDDIETKLGLNVLAVLPLDKKELNSVSDKKRKKLK